MPIGGRSLVMAAAKLVTYARKYAANIESNELADIVVNHAIASGVSGMASGVLPGAGSLIAGGVAVGAIWRMYYKIGTYLHLQFNTDLLKAVAAAVLSNIVTQLGGVLALELATTFIPGWSIVATGLIFFSVTYVAGLMFLEALIHIFKAGNDPSRMSEARIKELLIEAAKSTDAKSAFKEAKKGFKDARKDGAFDDKK